MRRIEIPLPYENSFNKYNNPYNHEKFIKICKEYGVSDKNEDSDENKVSDENEDSCDLTKWRNQKYFTTSQVNYCRGTGLFWQKSKVKFKN